MNDASKALRAKVLFYGDDFTGASDNAAQYARHGLKTVLFFSDPGADELTQAAQVYDVVGVAGTARSLDPDGMRAELMPVLEKFRQLKVPLVQYKCCSTFDSSPDTGSLGHAMQLMQACWPSSLIPVLAATPEFGRYTMFGHHYARAGTAVYRLDRHPVMSRHPVTPMNESDLSSVLTKQGFTPSHTVDLRLLDHFEASPDALAAELITHDSVVFDGYTLKQVITAAASLWHVAQERQVCAMAAQGFAHGLGAWLRESGRLQSSQPTHKLDAVDRLLVLSGSCSSLSAEQIAWAREAGFLTMRADLSLLTGEDPGALNALENRMLDALKSSTSVIVFTAEGPDDALVSAASTQAMSASAMAQRIGHVFARLARVAFAQSGLQRLVVAGGDSSSFTMRDIRASALEIKASHFGQNAHVCTLVSDDPLIHDKEVLLKGGQVGQANLYGLMLAGFSNSSP
ncbi:Four-carbon acid sugar kinase, N-terminal domain containing protein [Oxalobacteraceae bacterium]